MPRLGANLSWLFGELPFAQRFDAAAASGFAGVECLFPYEIAPAGMARLLRNAGVTLELFNAPAGDWEAGERGVAGLPGRKAECDAGTDRARRYADRCGTPRIHVMAGIVPPGVERERCLDTYLANLDRAARALAEDGRVLLIEPINTRDMPGYLLATLEEAVAVVAAVGADNLRIQADLYHLQIMGGDLIRRVSAALPRIAHVQIAGVPDRGEPDRGELRHEALFAMLDAAGYDGWVGCEYRPRGRTGDGLAWAAPWLRPGPRLAD
jgi:hydroxypyruvate isomerase